MRREGEPNVIADAVQHDGSSVTRAKTPRGVGPFFSDRFRFDSDASSGGAVGTAVITARPCQQPLVWRIASSATKQRGPYPVVNGESPRCADRRRDPCLRSRPRMFSAMVAGLLRLGATNKDNELVARRV